MLDTGLADYRKSIEQRRRSFLTGLCCNVAIFAVLSSLLWGLRFGSWYAVELSFIAPPVYAFYFTLSADVEVAVVSWVVTALAVVFVLLGARKPRLVLTVLAHVSLALYWLWSFALIGMGV